MNSFFAEHKQKGLLAVLAGIVAGFFVLAYASLALRWVVSFTFALAILFSGISARNSRKFFLSLFALSLPIVAYNYVGKLSQFHYGGPAGFYNTLYDFPLLLLFILWIPKVIVTKSIRLRFDRLDFYFWGLIGLSVLSVYNAADIMLCLYAIFRLAIMYLIFMYLKSALQEKSDLKFIIVPMLIGLLLESAFGIAQYYFGQVFGLELVGEREIVSFHSVSRVGGTLGHPNSFARYLSFLIPLTISLLWAPIRKEYKIFCGCIFLLSVSTLVATFSRSAWGGFSVSMLVLLILGIRAKLFSLSKVLLIAISGCLFLLVIAFIFQDVIHARLFLDDYGAARSRIPLMKVALNIIRNHPFLGVGINNYSEVMRGFDNTFEGISSVIPNVVHSSYLLIASEIGIGGLLLFLLFTFEVLRTAWRILSSDDKFLKCVIAGIAAGFSSFLIQITVMPPAMTDVSFLFFWAFSGVIVAISNINAKEAAITGNNHESFASAT